MSFVFQIENKPEGCTLHISGEIGETAKFNQIGLPDIKHLILDLQNLNFLNSVGLRSLVLWMQTVKCSVITIKNCPSVAVHQINVLNGFLPARAVFESFELPYTCDACGHKVRTWLTRNKDFMEPTADEPEWIKFEKQVKCPSCGKDADLDVMPLRYFSFLKNRKS